MTGFARSQGRTESGATWVWEARSVNHKGLDLRCRVPSGFEAWETKVRDATTQRFTRGAITVGLVLNGVAEAPAYTLNEPLLNELVRMAQALRARHGEALAPPSIDGLLAVKGVLEVGEDSPDPEQTQARDTALQDSLEQTLASLSAMRAREGARLEIVLTDQLSRIDALTRQARALAAVQPEAIKARLKAQVAELLGASPALPEDRLAQEAALLATKADVREELDRLGAHVAEARRLLAKGGPVGRRLDFLCQEFNREANTLCSKSCDVELTALGLDLKTVIDQMREQVQNLE